MSVAAAVPARPHVKRFRSPKTVVARFVARRTSRGAIILGLVLCVYIISKATGFIKAYPTVAGREQLAATLGSNVGIEALLGTAHHINTIKGYAVWNFLCLIAAAGAVWALLAATKTFRGEEEAGHWELLLAGQTTARRAAAGALAGLGSGLVIIYVFLVLAIMDIGRLQGADFTARAGLFFALALVAGAAEFMAVGMFASQLMATRSRAAGMSAVAFGVFYMIRLIADTTNAHWLLNISPLGWIEKLQPMYDSQALWLLPIGIFIAVLCGLAVFLAGRRDLGGSIFADNDTAKPRTRLLHSPFMAAVRLTRAVTLSWLCAVAIMAFLYGSLAKGAAQAFSSQSANVQKVLGRLDQAQHAAIVSEFMGLTFFLVMILLMFYAASAVGRIREDEAEGYVDNFLVRSVSRLRWLSGRVFLAVIVIVLAGLISSLATWAGAAAQHTGVALHTLLLAGVNIMAPVVFIVGLGIAAFGVKPRLTGAITYGAIGWSFLIVMLSSGLTFNHWLLDTSVLHHITLAPAANADWTADAVIAGISLLLAVVGALAFNARDVQLD